MNHLFSAENNPILWREQLSLERSSRFSRLFKIIYWSCGALFVLFLCALFSLDPYEIAIPVVIFVLFLQCVVLIFFVPPLTAGAIANERKQETLDLLLTTSLSVKRIIDGKLLATLPFVFRLVLWLAVPLPFCLLSPDINLLHIFLAQLVILTTAVFITVFTLYLSTLFTNTTSLLATVYGAILLYTIISLLITAYITGSYSSFDFFLGFSTPIALGTAFFPTEFDFPPPLSHTILYGLFSYLLYQATLRQMRKLANR